MSYQRLSWTPRGRVTESPLLLGGRYNLFTSRQASVKGVTSNGVERRLSKHTRDYPVTNKVQLISDAPESFYTDVCSYP